MTWIARIWKTDATGEGPETDVGSDLGKLEASIGYEFRNRGLLINALRHRSYVHTGIDGRGGTGKPEQANERLEFLGDAVLGLVTTRFLYLAYPDKPEGELTKRKSVLVSKSVLAECAVEVGVDEHLLLSDLEESAGGRQRRSILGDAFEALLGAMFLDGGLKPVTAFLESELFPRLDELIHDTSYINYKSLLLEHVQAQGNAPPEYVLCRQTGPDHRKTFTVDVLISGDVMGRGIGKSKKDAQQIAAKHAWERLTGEPEETGETSDEE